MRFAEILNELTYGRVGTSVSTIDKTAPWVKKGIKTASDRTKKFNELQTAAEKFKFLHRQSDGFKTGAIRVNFSVGSDGMSMISFDPDTGNLVLRAGPASGKYVSVYKTTIDDFEYRGRDRTHTGSIITYRFKQDNPTGEFSRIPNDNFKPSSEKISANGSSRKIKPNDEFKKLSNNPFGI